LYNSFNQTQNRNVSYDQLFGSNQAPVAYFIWPPFAFYRALSVINAASYTTGLRPYRFSDLHRGDEVFNALLFLIGETFVFFGLAFYLSSVLPNEFGMRKPWHFPISELFARNLAKSKTKENASKSDEVNVQIDSEELKYEDSDGGCLRPLAQRNTMVLLLTSANRSCLVKAERVRVMAGDYPPNSPLVIKGMRKLYSGRNVRMWVVTGAVYKSHFLDGAGWNAQTCCQRRHACLGTWHGVWFAGTVKVVIMSRSNILRRFRFPDS
jgi:hypothetical protein